MKKFFLFLFFIFLIPLVFGGEWREVGSDNINSYVQDNGVSYVNDNYSFNIYNAEKISLTEPLVADLDADGLNELIIFRNEEIRLYNTVNYVEKDTYVSSNISVVGNAEVVDFDGDGALELVFITSILSNYSFYVMNYSNDNFYTEQIITNVSASYGLNCYPLYDGVTQCCYVDSDGNFNCYDSTNSFITTPKINVGETGCLDGSIPSYIDYDNDGTNDVFFIHSITCNNLMVYKNNGDGTFTWAYNVSTSSGINQYAVANLDGGIKELITTASCYCGSNAPNCCGTTDTIYVNKLSDGTSICNIKSDSFSGTHQQPYLTALNTCYANSFAGECDFDSNGYDDFSIVAIFFTYYDIDQDNTPLILGFDESCNEIYNEPISSYDTYEYAFGGTPETFTSTTNYAQAVIQNFDLDSSPEIFLSKGVYDYNGNAVVTLKDKFNDKYGLNQYTYLVAGDLNGDGANELIFQTANGTYINVTYFSYNNILPFIDETFWNTGNPICVDTTVTYTIEFTDFEGDYSRIAIDCLGNGVLTNNSFYLEDPEATCLYNTSGDYTTRLYLQDTAHVNDFTVYSEHAVTITDSAFCNDVGVGASSSEYSSTGTSSGVGDFASEIPDVTDELGFKSTASKILLALALIITMMFGSAKASAKMKHGEYVIALVCLLTAIGCVYIGWLPLWIIFLLFIFVCMLVFLMMAFKRGE